jgi:hypothetical protein
MKDHVFGVLQWLCSSVLGAGTGSSSSSSGDAVAAPQPALDLGDVYLSDKVLIYAARTYHQHNDMQIINGTHGNYS